MASEGLYWRCPNGHQMLYDVRVCHQCDAPRDPKPPDPPPADDGPPYYYRCTKCLETVVIHDLGTLWRVMGKGDMHNLAGHEDDDPRLCGPVTKIDPPANEHQRLADAAGKLTEAIDPDFVGDLPTALEALANAVTEYSGHLTEDLHEDLGTALRKVSRT